MLLYMLVRYASPSGPKCLRCLMLTLLGFVELLFYCHLYLCCGECYFCSLYVFLSMCLFVLCVLCLTVLVKWLLNAFALCVGEVNDLSLTVIVLFCWLIPVWSSKEYVGCVYDPSVCLGVLSICQIRVFI